MGEKKFGLNINTLLYIISSGNKKFKVALNRLCWLILLILYSPKTHLHTNELEYKEWKGQDPVVLFLTS